MLKNSAFIEIAAAATLSVVKCSSKIAENASHRKEGVGWEALVEGSKLTANYYIGHVNVDVDPKLITDDIESLGVRIVEFEQLELKHNRFKSFQLCIRKSDFSKLLVEDFWPEEVVFDCFFWGKTRNAESQRSNNDAE